MFAYCGNNPVNREDTSGYLWGFIKEFVSQIANAINVFRPIYAVAGGFALVDGPLPIGDLVGLVVASVATIGVVGYALSNSISYSAKSSSGDAKEATSDNPIIGNVDKKVPNSETNAPSKRGNAPVSKKDGRPIELHHKNQSANGTFDEMHASEHRFGNNYKSNHPDFNKPSKVNRKDFRKNAREYWQKEWDVGRWR